MRELHVVALSEDGRSLHLATTQDARKGGFRIAIDSRLTAALRGELAHPGQQQLPASALTPKDIQARLRAGETAEEIAASAGVPVARVERFSGPVEAERAGVVDAVRAAVLVRGRRGASVVPLGAAVDEHLALLPNLREGSVRWTARRQDSGIWLVDVAWVARGRSKSAGWTWDPSARHVAAADAASLALGHLDTRPTTPVGAGAGLAVATGRAAARAEALARPVARGRAKTKLAAAPSAAKAPAAPKATKAAAAAGAAAGTAAPTPRTARAGSGRADAPEKAGRPAAVAKRASTRPRAEAAAPAAKKRPAVGGPSASVAGPKVPKQARQPKSAATTPPVAKAAVRKAAAKPAAVKPAAPKAVAAKAAATKPSAPKAAAKPTATKAAAKPTATTAAATSTKAATKRAATNPAPPRAEAEATAPLPRSAKPPRSVTRRPPAPPRVAETDGPPVVPLLRVVPEPAEPAEAGAAAETEPKAAPRSAKGRASVPAWADVLLGTTARDRSSDPEAHDR